MSFVERGWVPCGRWSGYLLQDQRTYAPYNSHNIRESDGVHIHADSHAFWPISVGRDPYTQALHVRKATIDFGLSMIVGVEYVCYSHTTDHAVRVAFQLSSLRVLV